MAAISKRRMAGRRGIWCAVDQTRQHREPSDAVRHRVVQDDHQARVAAGQPGDQRRGPQRRRQRQPGGDQRQGDIQQGPLVAWRGARHRADMPADVEPRVVGPDRAAAPERHPDQALAQPRDRRQPPGDQPADPLNIQSARLVEHQDHGELLGNIAGVHRQDRPVGSARALDHRLPARRHRGRRCHGTSQRPSRPPDQSRRSCPRGSPAASGGTASSAARPIPGRLEISGAMRSGPTSWQSSAWRLRRAGNASTSLAQDIDPGLQPASARRGPISQHHLRR
jgi:hypothetical protein